MSDVLTRICDDKRAHIAAKRAERSFAEIDRAALKASPPRGFKAALRREVDAGRHGLIAEIKRASPSKGLIRQDFNPSELARAYQAGGAACLSILTDIPYFQGQDSFLVEARAACDLPCLRKDFMLDPYQVVEARALGADCILLIMAALDDGTARELADVAARYGMDVLVEVHNGEELTRALQLPCELIGVNNRNLKTLSVDLAVTEELASRVPTDRVLVSESGLYGPEDLERMAKVGAHCFLVGESLMRQTDVTAATRALLARREAA
ncbi:indole-3-glycerol-phosphate synthase [Skermanella stibiiresistens SB22]|uniref:Indole-3-glycerol phosphate synthase n=1 Tax=Skermanella stibiiresistens SB22 TaxID=1385369 RepID=W9GSF9_9PROT|nr:indole-3-glycerol phosphate synthase TrpC [Skermanella stibiiresistens]EWY36830.1 indole-3-glycerol-phosphate synthase [Skermanella stibiiresistens SB22]